MFITLSVSVCLSTFFFFFAKCFLESERRRERMGWERRCTLASHSASEPQWAAEWSHFTPPGLFFFFFLLYAINNSVHIYSWKARSKWKHWISMSVLSYIYIFVLDSVFSSVSSGLSIIPVYLPKCCKRCVSLFRLARFSALYSALFLPPHLTFSPYPAEHTCAHTHTHTHTNMPYTSTHIYFTMVTDDTGGRGSTVPVSPL